MSYFPTFDTANVYYHVFESLKRKDTGSPVGLPADPFEGYVTEWFSPYTAPLKPGKYQRKYDLLSHRYSTYDYWNGKEWITTYNSGREYTSYLNLPWRGRLTPP